MTKQRTLLLVEDDEMISSMYKTKFEQSGFKVITAATGAEGLEQAQKTKPDIILLDIIMPQLDGFAVLKELKFSPKTKKIPVILLTNLGTAEDQEKGKKLGAADYLVKANLTPSQVCEKVLSYFKK